MMAGISTKVARQIRRKRVLIGVIGKNFFISSYSHNLFYRSYFKVFKSSEVEEKSLGDNKNT